MRLYPELSYFYVAYGLQFTYLVRHFKTRKLRRFELFYFKNLVRIGTGLLHQNVRSHRMFYIMFQRSAIPSRNLLCDQLANYYVIAIRCYTNDI